MAKQAAYTENCALLGYYTAISDNSYLCYGTTYWSHPRSSRIQNKAHSPNTEFIQGRVWAVKSLSSMVSASRAVVGG
jgi:hypothetical protein